jgi:acyl dehydratase
MKIGDFAETKRAYGAEDVTNYHNLTHAPLLDSEVPGPLIGALFSYLLGVKLPGVGTNYLKQDSTYHQSAKIGETLTARVTITELRLEKFLVDLETTCFGEDGRLICDGRALVYVRDVENVVS